MLGPSLTITAMQKKKIVIATDSEYVYKGVNTWSHKWKQKGWVNSQEPIENLDLCIILSAAIDMCDATLEWLWCPSHTGIEGNENADQLAEKGRLSSPLYDKCNPGSVARPIDIDTLFPSPARTSLPIQAGTPMAAEGVVMDGWLTLEPNRAQHTLGVNNRQGRPDHTPPVVFDLTSPLTPMPGVALDLDSDVESPARILRF